MHRERYSPILLGHEATGVILKKGSAVTHVDEGDIVLVTWVPRAARDAAGLPVRATLEVAGAPRNPKTYSHGLITPSATSSM